MSHFSQDARAAVLGVLTVAFRQNPWLAAIAPPDTHPRRYRSVLEYACATAEYHDGVHVSPCGEAVALYYVVWPDASSPLRLTARKLWLALGHFAWWDVPAILRHQARVKAVRPCDEPYLYCWFLGATPRAARAGTTRPLVDQLFAHARALALPIYAETTLVRNCRVYERFGFETYATVPNPRFGVTSYCLRWTADSATVPVGRKPAVRLPALALRA